MSDHLSSITLSALIDGELLLEQSGQATAHLAECHACTSNALSLSMLKSATARAGVRYAPPAEFQQRLAQLAAQPTSLPVVRPRESASGRDWRNAAPAWMAAAALLLVLLSIGLVKRAQVSIATRNSLVAEVCDQHFATLAAALPPQVLSSDRHTVKPWFQGKVPFSFDLPEDLPADTTLTGANLTYLHNRPAAQLLYSLGKHRVSVFLLPTDTQEARDFAAERTGLHVREFALGDLEAVAVSDADPARLAALIQSIQRANSR